MTFYVTVKIIHEPYLEAKLSLLECGIISVTNYGTDLLLYKVSGSLACKEDLMKLGYLIDEETFATYENE